MRKLNIEVHEDSGRPGGGHAVIRLLGLDNLPDNVTFRLKPVEAGHHADAQSAWLEGERMPLASRITTQGAELVVGPDIVENPMFLPGTLAVIEIAKCGVRGEFLWPRIAPIARPKRRHLIGAKPLREAPSDPAPLIYFEEATDASSSIQPLPPPIADPVPLLKEQLPNSAPALVTAVDAAKPASIATTPVAANDTAAPTELLAPDLAHTTTGAEQQVRQLEPAVAMPPAAGQDVQWTGAVAPSPVLSRKRIAALVASIGLGIGALAYALPGRLQAPTATGVTASLVRPANEPSLSVLISTEPKSPTSVDVGSAGAAKLLEDADTNLHAAEGDKREARLLLRRYLSGTLGDDRTLWALTQLGSLYADPPAGETADYAKARQLWELASSLGDGVAMCFLSSLHEHGLGVSADRAAALSWLMRSKSIGGCRNIDASIARLQPRK